MGPITKLDVLDVRIPQWDQTQLVDRNCPLCEHAGEARYVRPDLLTVRECMHCGLFFISPGPTHKTLSEFYAKYYTEYFRTSPDLKAVLKAIKGQVYNRLILELGSLRPLRGATLLDVGCGLGSFLKRCEQLGASVAGIDLDPAAVSFCKESLYLKDVHFGSIDTMAKDRRFDIITMSNVIEHPLSPLSILESCIDRLNPGGLLALTTPNGGFADPRFEPLVQFRVDLEHMQYFTARACGYVAEKFKAMHIVHLETLGDPFLAEMKCQSKVKPKAPLAKRLVQKVPGFGQVAAMRYKMQFFDERMGTYLLICIFCKSAG